MTDTFLQPPPQTRATKKWFHERTLFAVLIVLNLIPIWSFKYIPTQDGPAHLYNSWLLTQHGDGSKLWEYFEINTKLPPNWFSHLAMAGLMSILSPLTSEKILLSGYIILLPLAMRYAVKSIRPNAGFVAILIFPLTYNFLFHLGFYNFLFGVSMMLFVIGFWMRHQDQFEIKHALIFFVLLMIVFFCHLLPLAVGLMAIALTGGWLTIIDLRQMQTGRMPKSTVWRYFRSRAVVPFISAIPVLILGVIFFATKAAVHAAESPLDVSVVVGAQSTLDKILWPFRRYASFQETEAAVWFAYLLMLFGIAVVLVRARTKLRMPQRWDGLFLVLPVLVAAVFLAPKKFSGENIFLRNRLELMLFLLTIVWLATQTWSVNLQRLMQVVATAIALAMLAINLDSYRLLNPLIDEIDETAAQIQPYSTVGGYSFARLNPSAGRASWGLVDPFLHAYCHAAMGQKLINLTNYEARTDYFPIKSRDRDGLMLSENNPTYRLNWCWVNSQPGTRLSTTNPTDLSDWQRLYVLIFTSPAGHATLFRLSDVH